MRKEVYNEPDNVLEFKIIIINTTKDKERWFILGRNKEEELVGNAGLKNLIVEVCTWQIAKWLQPK